MTVARSLVLSLAVVVLVVLPNFWMHDAYGTPDSFADVLAGLCLSLLYGGAVGQVVGRLMFPRLFKRNG